MRSPRSDSIRQWSNGDYVVSTDPARVDLDVVHAFLSGESYWAHGRPRELQVRANEMSRCFSVLHESTGTFVGFARVLTDDVSFGWVADVFVVGEHRGHGVGVFLMQCVVEAHLHISRLVLGTRDAHGVYAKVGFQPLRRVERWMELWNRAPPP